MGLAGELAGELPRPLCIVGAAALAAPGLFRGRGNSCRLGPGPGVASSGWAEVSSAALATAEGCGEPGGSDGPKALRQMSRSARLAAATMAQLLADADWPDGRRSIGAFLGVGSSGAAVGDLATLLSASVVGGEFSLAAFGQRGLRAVSPLLAFQLMNNFTLCHGAIASGLGGPSGAYFSRGAGTVSALHAAAWTLLDPGPSVDGDDSGAPLRLLVGGADSALHPVTVAELRRAGALDAGLRPGEGAALLALTTAPGKRAALGWLLGCAVVPLATGGPLSATGLFWQPLDAARLDGLDRALGTPLLAGADAAVLVAGLEATRQLLRQRLCRRWPHLAGHLIDTAGLGETLAAAAALGWCVALEALREGGYQRIAVLSLGLDGDLGLVLLGGQP